MVSKVLFEAAKDQRDRDIAVHVTALEIYNERIRDLLQDGTENQDLDVVDQTKRATVVRGLTEARVQSSMELDHIAAVASARRTVRARSAAHPRHNWRASGHIMQRWTIIHSLQAGHDVTPDWTILPAGLRGLCLYRKMHLQHRLQLGMEAGRHWCGAGPRHKEQCCQLPFPPHSAHPLRQQASRCCTSGHCSKLLQTSAALQGTAPSCSRPVLQVFLPGARR